MNWLRLFGAAGLLLLLGDFVATFGYHVPEHVFGKFHSIVHHSPKRSFVRYAIKNRQPIALIDGFLSAFPYLMFIPILWKLSPWGVGLGLLLAELHVLWRHQFSLTYRTPYWLQKICKALYITTPERHWIHHRYANKAFGDIFAFYGKPAEWWLKQLRLLKRRSQLQ
ncbi:sterol desaturase family protein [Oscillatoria sp. CS-180]|uniref:sterol desaturase family protein n=1 Tax=Oscillatoria sp. CS-180 TaxID=3021720 RepID=UPI00232D4CE5|nr:sterol desaturase family protein [Oscillatoria sp. CS-180]MDB9529053.1 sterol desaturase family protein [Oscillatoria sp. CS-180]